MTLYLLKVYLQTFLSVPITQKSQILTCDTLVADEQNFNEKTSFDHFPRREQIEGRYNFEKFTNCLFVEICNMYEFCRNVLEMETS
jgi:hypothetical protein